MYHFVCEKEKLLPHTNLPLHKSWEKHKYFEDYMGCLQTCEEVLIPFGKLLVIFPWQIYIPILWGGHYSLARVLIKTLTVEVWDSAASQGHLIYNERIIKTIVS